MDAATTNEEMIRQITRIPDDLSASTCFGTPVERGNRVVIPVARVSFGFGLGFGRGAGSDGPSSNGHGGGGEGEGGGGGGGGNATPVAVIEVTDNETQITPIVDTTAIAIRNTMVGAWLGFWLLWTIRTITRERAKTRRIEVERAS